VFLPGRVGGEIRDVVNVSGQVDKWSKQGPGIGLFRLIFIPK